jgi:hypothetical protein
MTDFCRYDVAAQSGPLTPKRLTYFCQCYRTYCHGALCDCGEVLMKHWIGDLLDWMFLVDEDARPRIGVVTLSAR